MSVRWIWPAVGPTPVNQGLDSEMFDRTDYPYSETFVREAIQNSLDARLNPNEPVVIRFGFHDDNLGRRERFLARALAFRDQAGLSVPGGNRIRWITVEDFNTKGLLGDLDDRRGDFWNYWLNFGISNKSGTGRGGRGIGRVTFLIASQIHTVLGLTRRSTDGVVAACGMSVLKAGPQGDEFKSTHAYLAAEENGSVYTLHGDDDFHLGMEEAFGLSGYATDEEQTGLALIIPWPYEELDDDGILAAAIDHFAPAIIDGALVVEVGPNRLDRTTIAELAPCVAKVIKTKSVAEGADRYLEMIGLGLEDAPVTLELSRPNEKLGEHRESDLAEALRTQLDNGEDIVFRIDFPITRHGRAHQVGLTVVAREAPYDKAPIDRLFREGMSLPDVKSRRPGEIDLMILVEDELLAQCLNFCEGKAHLDLLESKEVRAKLEEQGFSDGIQVKRLVKSLPDEIRQFLTAEKTEPDSTVLDSFFAVPDPEVGRTREAGERRRDRVPQPNPEPPPPNVPAVRVQDLANGFRLSPNDVYRGFPATVDVRVAYADGTRSPGWSEYDFLPRDLDQKFENCAGEFSDNRLRITDWSDDSLVEITGFDARRELDLRIRTTSDAAQG